MAATFLNGGIQNVEPNQQCSLQCSKNWAMVGGYRKGSGTLFFYKKLAIRNRGLKWQKFKKLQGWTRTDLRNCQIQKKIQKC